MVLKKINDLAVAGSVTDNMQLETDIAGTTANRVTALQIKNYVGVGQEEFDATVGAVGSGADYNHIQTAITAAKYNLLIIGDFIEADPGGITTGANFVQITIAERLQLSNTNFTVGTGGIKVRGGIIAPTYTGTVTKIFTSPALATLNLANVTFFMNAATIANSGIADMFLGSKHLVHNCNFVLSNTSGCGFDAPGDNSSFTNLNVIGGGASCEKFIQNMQDNGVISDINISGTFKDNTDFIRVDDGNVVISNINSTVTQAIKITGIGTSKLIVSNVYGPDGLNLNFSSTTLTAIFSNCVFKDFNVGPTNAGFYSNIKTTGSTTITIYGVNNSYTNCDFNAAVTMNAGSDNNHLLLCKTAGVYTDGGTNNSFIEGISEDKTLSSDSNRLLVTEQAIKTYADNIAKGITVEYFFSDTAEGVIPNYDLMYPSDTGQIESSVGAIITAPDTLIASWVTETTQPNFTTLLAGIYAIHIHAAKTAGTKDVHIYYKFYKRTHPGGVETLLATSDNSGNLTSGNVGYTLHETLPDDVIIADTDRLVTKSYGTPTGVGTDPTATLYLEGTNSSRMDIHTTTSSWMLNLQNIIYVNGAGNDSNAGKNMGTPKLTIAAALTAAALQSPTATNIVVVKVLGGLRYAEDVTVPSWVVLDMSDAISNGQVTVGVTMGADSFYYFNEAIMPSGKESVRCIGAGVRHIKGNFTTPETSSTFLTAVNGPTVYLDINNADAVKTGAKFYDISAGGTRLYLNARRFAETVASTSDAASNVVAHIGERVAAGYTDNISHAGDFIFRGLDSTGYVGFGGTVSTTYPRTKRKRVSGTLAAAGGFVSIPPATLGISTTFQIVNATVWGWYPAASAWIPNGNLWGEVINLRIMVGGVQIETPAASTGMAAQKFHLVYEYQQTDFLTP